MKKHGHYCKVCGEYKACLLYTSLYLEVFFPEHNVRYIAVNDGVDTLNKSAMDITPFRNILNGMYAADISVKIKSAYRARFQQGKFMGTDVYKRQR